MFEGDPGLRIGTSSWSERDWLGVFYPPGTPAGEFIRHYSGVYDTVELDASFYGIPTEAHVAGWCDRTPDSFRFAAKTPKLITHEKRLEGAVGDMEVFLEAMQGLGPRLGPILLQFPYFNRSAFSGPAPFFKRLDRFLGLLPTEARFAVEVRNPRWLGSELNQICVDHHVCLAWAEQSWMPPAEQWPELTGGPSTDFAYVRFLGDHKEIEKVTNRWDKVVVDRSEEIAAWISIIRGLRAQGIDVFAFFNNHFAGHAPATIETFRELYCGLRRDPPPALEQGNLFDGG